MEYNEETALQLIAKFELDANTNKVWKTRNKIPDKYFKEGFEKRKPLGRGDLFRQDQLRKVLKSEKINTLYVGEIADIPYHKLSDCIRELYNLSLQDLNQLIKVVQQIRIEIKEVVDLCANRGVFTQNQNKALLKLLKSDRFIFRPLLDFDDLDYSRVIAWRVDKMDDIPDPVKRRVVDRLALFLLETTI